MKADKKYVHPTTGEKYTRHRISGEAILPLPPPGMTYDEIVARKLAVDPDFIPPPEPPPSA